MDTSLVESVEGVEPEERLLTISRRFEEMERRLEDVEAGQMVSDDGLLMVEVMSQLDRLREQNAALLSALRAFLAQP